MSLAFKYPWNFIYVFLWNKWADDCFCQEFADVETSLDSRWGGGGAALLAE